MHHEHVVDGGDARDRREIAQRIVACPGVEADVARKRGRLAELAQRRPTGRGVSRDVPAARDGCRRGLLLEEIGKTRAIKRAMSRSLRRAGIPPAVAPDVEGTRAAPAARCRRNQAAPPSAAKSRLTIKYSNNSATKHTEGAERSMTTPWFAALSEVEHRRPDAARFPANVNPIAGRSA